VSTLRLYRLVLVAVFALIFAAHVRSQTCEPNMLFIQDSTGYAYVPKFSASKLGTSFTIEFWVQSLQSQKGKGILEIGRTGDTGSVRFEIDSSLMFRATAAFTGGTRTLASLPVSQLVWNHVALALSPNDTLKLYLNGTLAASQKVASRTLRKLGDTLFIGKSSLTGMSLYGNIDEVRIWNYERTRSEINTTISQVIPDNTTGLIAYFRMDDRTGAQRIHDFTGKENKGFIAGNALTTTSSSPVTGQDHPGYMLSSLEKVVDMGIISCGDSRDTIVHITNLGFDTLGIGALGFTNSGFVFSINTSSGFPLPPDKDRFAIVKLQADAKGVGFFTDTLVIISSTECGGSVRIIFKIQVDSAGIRFSAPTSKIENEDILSCLLPLNYSLTLENTGSSDITIISKQFSANVGIEYVSPPLPFTINKNKDTSIIVRILPGSMGKFTTQFSVTTKECSKVAAITIEGERTEVKFDLLSQVTIPDQYFIVGGFVDTTIIFINTGSSAIFIPDVIIQNQPGSTTFRKISPANGAYLYPGDTLKTLIRAFSDQCGVRNAKLLFKGIGNISCFKDTAINLKVTIRGPRMETKDMYDLGASCSAHDTTITFINRSEVTSILDKPTFDKANVFSYIDDGSLPKQLAPGDSVTIRVRFNPLVPRQHTVIASFSQTPCGFVEVVLKGYLGVGLIALSDSLVDFGLACDLSPQQKKITITNNAGKNVTVTTAEISGSSDYRLISPLPPFSLANGETKEVVIEYHPTALGIDSARLEMTDNGCFVSSIPLAGIREITSLALTTDTLYFDQTCPGKRSVKSVGLVNNGGGTVSISSTSFTENIYGVGNLSNVKVGAGSTANIPISFTPTSINNFEDVLTIVIAPCNDTLRLVLKGEGGPIADMILQDTLIEFGEIKVGDSVVICTKIVNPSCIPVKFYAGDLTLDGSFAFDLTDGSLPVFPVIVSRDEPLILCFIYKPLDEGDDTNRFTITTGGKSYAMKLHGSASSSHITHSSTVLDFGHVLLDNVNALSDTITNTGKYPVFFTNDVSVDPAFTIKSIPSFLQKGEDSLLTVTFVPTFTALYEDTIFMQWDNTIDTIILRGRGTGHGALVNKTQLDFGDVRINTSRSDVITITGGDGFPIILSNIVIVGDTSFTKSGPSKDTLLNSTDRALITVTYNPLLEVAGTAQLMFDDNTGNKKSVTLKGRGVEAHLLVDTTFIDFGTVKVGSEMVKNVIVTDGGNFPLTITGATPDANKVFGLKGLPQTIISPLQSENFGFAFRPVRDVEYFDRVRITADAPEKERIIVLRGEGTFGNIIYSVGDVVLNVGDIAEVPVSISGTDLPSTFIDSFTCVIHYDPTVMFVHTVLTENTLSSGMMMSLERIPKDSLIRVHGFGKQLSNTSGILFHLKTEALLGPVDTTRVVVVASSPKHDSPQAAQGLYTVADCGKYRTNIHYKGPYSLSAPKPNPVTSTLTLSYELGLDGYVSLDIIDELGVVVKRVLAQSQKRGRHDLVINVNDLPSGMYTYVLQSLEYREAKSFILSK
jgi:hypothetical protein